MRNATFEPGLSLLTGATAPKLPPVQELRARNAQQFSFSPKCYNLIRLLKINLHHVRVQLLSTCIQKLGASASLGHISNNQVKEI